MNGDLRVLIADDDSGMRMILRRLIEKADGFTLAGEASDGKQAIELAETLRPDVVFLDVEMPEMTGVECARVIQDMNPAILLIFATAHEGYMGDAFEVYAFDYLVKPITHEDFMGACEKVFNSYMQDDMYNPIKRDKFLIVKSDYRYIRVPFEKILFVESLKDYVMFHLEGGECITTLGNLKRLEEKLPREKFKRVHRSYLANMTNFETIERMKMIYGKLAIPISESFKDEILKFIDEHEI